MRQKTVEEDLPIVGCMKIEVLFAVTTDTWYGKMSPFEIDVERGGNEPEISAFIQYVMHPNSKSGGIQQFKLFRYWHYMILP